MIYKFTCPRCFVIRKFKLKRPYEKNVEQGCCCFCAATGEHQCSRCNLIIKYDSRQAFKIAKKSNNCRKCKKIPDSALENFKCGIFSKDCPKCNATQTYSSKPLMLSAIRIKTICHSCAAKKFVSIVRLKIHRTKMRWTSEKHNQVSANISMAHKARFASLSLEEQEVVRQRGRDALKKLRENTSPEEKEKWNRRLRKAFVKYRGNNHWMKRPEVLQKVKDSCIKYRGNNHWSHRLRNITKRKK
jgi:hypothetical protein